MKAEKIRKNSVFGIPSLYKICILYNKVDFQMEIAKEMRTEGFLHTLTPLCVYDELTLPEILSMDRSRRKIWRNFSRLSV